VILRGGRDHPNFGSDGVGEALELLRGAGLAERLLVDASHDNSGKDHRRQPKVAAEISSQVAAGNEAIVGVMLESFLVGGRQDHEPGADLVYGQSITDACMDWDTTVLALDRLAAAVRERRKAA
jgi:3-deoxy-7-phosphoheptulonate synthase